MFEGSEFDVMVSILNTRFSAKANTIVPANGGTPDITPDPKKSADT